MLKHTRARACTHIHTHTHTEIHANSYTRKCFNTNLHFTKSSGLIIYEHKNIIQSSGMCCQAYTKRWYLSYNNLISHINNSVSKQWMLGISWSITGIFIYSGKVTTLHSLQKNIFVHILLHIHHIKIPVKQMLQPLNEGNIYST